MVIFMTETPKSKLTVTSSLNEISRNQIGNRGEGGGGGGVTQLAPTPFYVLQASREIFKDKYKYI
jgi:hypothetical protein